MIKSTMQLELVCFERMEKPKRDKGNGASLQQLEHYWKEGIDGVKLVSMHVKNVIILQDRCCDLWGKLVLSKKMY